MKVYQRHLIVRSDGEMRVARRYPSRLRLDEVAFPLRVSVPDAWGKVDSANKIEITLPGPPAAVLP